MGCSASAAFAICNGMEMNAVPRSTAAKRDLRVVMSGVPLARNRDYAFASSGMRNAPAFPVETAKGIPQNWRLLDINQELPLCVNL